MSPRPDPMYAEIMLRKATSIVHYLLGFLCAIGYPFYPGLAIILFLSFVAWEYASSKDNEEACGDCHEALVGLGVGFLVIVVVAMAIAFL